MRTSLYFRFSLVLSLLGGLVAQADSDFNPRRFSDFESALGGSIPFPPEKLVKGLLSLDSSSNILGAIFPHGRSLERKVTDFNHPRTLMGWQSGATSTPYLLYMAYTPNAEELEIISWNWDLRQFDFKLVQDYAPGKNPKLVNAPRALCMACHQSGTPIFPQAPWSETTETTNDSPRPHIIDQLKSEAQDSLSHYFINAPFSFFQGARLSSPDMDIRVRQGNPMQQDQIICKNACGGDLKCRKSLLLSALFETGKRGGSSHLSSGRKNQMDHAMRAAWPVDGFNYVSDFIVDRSIPKDPYSFQFSEDPLMTRAFEDYHEPAEGTDSDFLANYARCWSFTPDQRSQIRSWGTSSLESAMNTEQMTVLVKNWLPSEASILNALSTAIQTPQSVLSKLLVDWNSPVEIKKIVSDPKRSRMSTELLYRKYCASCHNGPVSRPPILPLANLHQLDFYIGSANRTVRELLDPSRPIMPPAGANQPSLEERLQMLSDLR